MVLRSLSSLFSTRKELFFLLAHPALWLRRGLELELMARDPFEQFARWYKRAQRCWSIEFPNAFCLATVDDAGYPEGRMVLLKSFDERGFVFYTNTLSQKGRSLAARPRASATFYWGPLQWQVRVLGLVELVSDAEADSYFASRPRESQIGAWASLQSEVLESRLQLTERVRQYREQFAGQAVPRPPHWRGLIIVPHRIEFWELRLSRLHDRLVYEKNADGDWSIQRLYP